MTAEVDAPCDDALLDTNDKVYGLLYEMTNSVTGMNYVGQTLSHRKNKGKYRPFGIVGRFNDHLSEATNNTKACQCSFLNNAIRKYGKEAFSVTLLERCPVRLLDEREQFYIQHRNTVFPTGYNLTKGGKTGSYRTEHERVPLEERKKRGGCTSRSEETRAKMSKRMETRVTEAFCAERSSCAREQHNAKKMDRFKNCVVELDKLDSYIRKKGKDIVVTIGDQSASFSGKHETVDQLKERAKSFIEALNAQRYQTAGSP
jgi:group I intron endonuclease